MGLSTKQVNSDGLDWGQTSLLQAQTFQLPKSPPATVRRQQQQNQQQSEPLKCPRCESTNTKFCYYNNYNKQQPRHFCRACKRHWTKGGTLRNVPVGGGRKNKRLRKSSNTCAASTAATTTSAAIDQTDHDHHQEQKIMPQALYQALIGPPSSRNLDNNIIFSSSSSSAGLSSTALPFLHQSRNLCFDPFSSSISTTSSSFDTTLSSISTSLQSSNVYNYAAAEDHFKAMEEPTITSIMPNNPQHNWKETTTSNAVDVYSNDWNWEDIETLVSTDLNMPWNNSDIKP